MPQIADISIQINTRYVLNIRHADTLLNLIHIIAQIVLFDQRGSGKSTP